MKSQLNEQSPARKKDYGKNLGKSFLGFPEVSKRFQGSLHTSIFMEFFKPLFGCFNAIDFLGALGLKAYNFIKKRLRHRCFPANIAKFLSTPILKNICKRLLLWMCVL